MTNSPAIAALQKTIAQFTTTIKDRLAAMDEKSCRSAGPAKKSVAKKTATKVPAKKRAAKKTAQR